MNGRNFGEYRTPIGVPHEYERIPTVKVSARHDRTPQNNNTSSYAVPSYH